MADFVASATATSQGTTSLTVPLPTGWAEGHLCFLEVGVNDGSVTITPPSGWTALDSAPVAVGSSQMSVWYRVLQSGDASPQVGLASSFKCSGITSAYSSVDQGSPIAAVGTRGTRGSSSTDTVAGSVTTTAADQTVVGFFMEKSSTASSVTDPSGTTRRAVAFTTGGGAVSALTVDEVVASAGATGTRTAVYNVASGVGYGLLVAIEDGAPTPGSVTHAWVGAPTTGGFEVVAKLASATSVRLAVSTSSGMTSPVYTSAEAPDGDGYVRLAITGLAANTQYWWQLADTPSGGSESLIGSVGQAKTFPTGNASFTFAFAACQTNNNPDSEALDDIRAWGPLFLLHTGDLHYRDPSSTDADVHRGFIEGQIVGAGGLAQLLREVPTLYTRSDHDTAGDNSDSNTDVGLASIAAYRQVVPHPPLAAPTGDSLHYSFVVGRIRFIVLDIRNHYRSTGSDAQSSSKTMLGADQKQWLKDELLEAEPVKVVVSDVGWIGAASLSQGADKWWSYDDERTEIGNYIVAQGLADSVVMLTGDNHALLSDDGTNNSWGGFPVWGAAPLANISGGRYLNSYQKKYSPDPQEDVRNYGRVTVTDTGSSITLAFSGWDALNSVERVDGELVVDTSISGVTPAAVMATASARKVAVVSAVVSVAVCGTTAVRKAAPVSGATPVSASLSSVARKAAPATGVALAAGVPAGVARKAAPAVAHAALAGVSTSLVRKSASATGVSGLASAQSATAAKRAPVAGSSAAAAWSYRSQTISRAVTGTCSMLAGTTAAARKMLPTATTTAAGVYGSASAIHVAIAVGVTPGAAAGSGQAGKHAVAAGHGGLVFSAEAAARKMAAVGAPTFAMVTSGHTAAVPPPEFTVGAMAVLTRRAPASAWRNRRGPEMRAGGSG